MEKIIIEFILYRNYIEKGMIEGKKWSIRIFEMEWQTNPTKQNINHGNV